MNIELVKCELCGSDDFVTLWDKGVRDSEGKLQSLVVRDEEGNIVNGRNVICKKCGLVYVNPRMDKASLTEFYKDEYRKSYKPDRSSEAGHAMNAVQVLQRVVKDPYGKHFLDIGCSSGRLLAALRELGFPEGVESNVENANIGIAEGLVIHKTDFESYKPTAKFDVVTILNTLEHMPNPVEILKKIRSIMEPDGICLVCVPNIQNMLINKNVDAFLSNAHLYNFSPYTLGMMMKKAGLWPVLIESKYEELGDKIYIAAKIGPEIEIDFDGYQSCYEEQIVMINAIDRLVQAKIKIQETMKF